MIKEKIVYLVDIYKYEVNIDVITDKEFMSLAMESGTIYSLKGFEEALNLDEINMQHYLIKII